MRGAQRLIAMRLLDELEPTGWISTDLKAIATELKCELIQVEEVLEKLQNIEPAGLFQGTFANA